MAHFDRRRRPRPRTSVEFASKAALKWVTDNNITDDKILSSGVEPSGRGGTFDIGDLKGLERPTVANRTELEYRGHGDKHVVPLDGNGATLRAREWGAARRVHNPHRPPTPHLTVGERIRGEPEDEDQPVRQARLERDADKLERALVRKMMVKQPLFRPKYSSNRSQHGRKGQLPNMTLQSEMSVNSIELYKRLYNAFAYHDLDNTGELDADELKKVFEQHLHCSNDEVLRVLCTRYDEDGDGTADLKVIVNRLVAVANVPDGQPLPSPPQFDEAFREAAHAARDFQGEEEERRVEEVEKKYVNALFSKVNGAAPMRWKLEFKKKLMYFDLDGSGELEVDEFVKHASLTVPGTDLKDLALLARRYTHEDSDIISIERALDRIMSLAPPRYQPCRNVQDASHKAHAAQSYLVHAARRGSASEARGGVDSNNGPQTEVQRHKRKMMKLMAMLSDAMRSRMQDRNVLALRKVVNRMFVYYDKGDSGFLSYAHLTDALRVYLPSISDDDMAHLVQFFDKKKRGYVVQPDALEVLTLYVVRDGKKPHATGAGEVVEEEEEEEIDDDPFADAVVDQEAQDEAAREKRLDALARNVLTKIEMRSKGSGRRQLALAVKKIFGHFIIDTVPAITLSYEEAAANPPEEPPAVSLTGVLAPLPSP